MKPKKYLAAQLAADETPRWQMTAIRTVEPLGESGILCVTQERLLFASHPRWAWSTPLHEVESIDAVDVGPTMKRLSKGGGPRWQLRVTLRTGEKVLFSLVSLRHRNRDQIDSEAQTLRDLLDQ